MPQVSVIIPAYNSEKTIRETIESVLNQTFSDFELIIINDGSQDSTLDIISNIGDPRLKISSYSNAGPNVSRNRGIARASGEYISFIDADDLWTPNKLEAQLNALKANPETAIAYSWTGNINESGDFLRRGSHITVNGDVYAKLLLVDFIESGSNPLIRREAVVAVGGFDETLLAAQDWDMWLRLAARYQFVAVPDRQVLHRVSSNSWSADVLRQEAASLRVINRCFAQAPEQIQHLKQSSLANRYKLLTFMALQTASGRSRGAAAAKFLGFAIFNDVSLLKARVLVKVVFRIVVMILLPPKQAQLLLCKYKKLSNINALSGYLVMEP